MGRTLLSDAFDVGVDVAVAPAVDLEVARVVRHSSRTPLTLRLMLLLPLPLILKLRVWVDTLSDAFDVEDELESHVTSRIMNPGSVAQRFVLGLRFRPAPKTFQVGGRQN